MAKSGALRWSLIGLGALLVAGVILLLTRKSSSDSDSQKAKAQAEALAKAQAEALAEQKRLLIRGALTQEIVKSFPKCNASQVDATIDCVQNLLTGVFGQDSLYQTVQSGGLQTIGMKLTLAQRAQLLQCVSSLQLC